MPAPPASMSSQLERTSSILGEYMLKGWTLTDLHCDQCNITPLMREPAAQASAANRARIQFCAKCDGGPHGQRASDSQTTPEPPSSLPQIDFPSPIDPHPPISSSSSSARSLSIRGRPPSAPPNRALPATPLSPDGIASRIQSPPSRTRQLPGSASPSAAQRTRTSEENSELISQRLLQGYSLLQSSCPNPRCEGIPLIGFPRAKDGTRDPRRMCVGCGTGYVSEGAMGGLKPVTAGSAGPGAVSASPSELSRVVAQAGPSRPAGSGVTVSDVPRVLAESPRSKKRRELYETGEAINKTLRPNPIDESPPSSKLAQSPPRTLYTFGLDDAEEDLLPSIDPTPPSTRSGAGAAIITASLHNVTSSLALTLDRLAASLANQTAGPAADLCDARYFIDVKLHTEAIRDVLECVERVRRVQ